MSGSRMLVSSKRWHLSFFADTEGVVAKIKASAHQEFNRQDVLKATAISLN
jgi:hypothetical protein